MYTQLPINPSYIHSAGWTVGLPDEAGMTEPFRTSCTVSRIGTTVHYTSTTLSRYDVFMLRLFPKPKLQSRDPWHYVAKIKISSYIQLQSKAILKSRDYYPSSINISSLLIFFTAWRLKRYNSQVQLFNI